MAAAVKVEGLRELQGAFRSIDRALSRDLQADLKKAAEPVRVAAQEITLAQIRNVGPKWSLMRIGVTGRAVYVAPAARRAGGSPRPNMGRLLFRTMTSALDRERDRVVSEIDLLLGRLAGENGF